MIATDAPSSSIVEVAGITFVVCPASETADNKPRWDRRADALTQLLLALWREEHGQPETHADIHHCGKTCLEVLRDQR